MRKFQLPDKKVPVYFAIISVVAAVVITFNASFIFFEQKYNKKLNSTVSENSLLNKLISVDELVKKYYIGQIDGEYLEDSVVNGYLSGIGDEYSLYLTEEEYKAFVKEQSGSAVAIGISVVYTEENMEIISVIPDSSADYAGLREGDILIGIDGKLISEIGYYEALNLIIGEEGTEVSLKVTRNGEEFSAVCIRREISTRSVEYHIFGGTGNVGVVSISEFNSTTLEQLRAAVEQLKTYGCNKFVFDVRNNGGGELSSVVEVIDYLLPEGPVAHVYYNTGEEAHYSSDSVCLDAKTAILINERTASAAELFACSFKDYSDNGKIDSILVGTITYGKGVLQNYFLLKDGSAFKISTGTYDPPYSENYDKKGVSPDIEVELSDDVKNINFYKLTDENDNQLITAVEALNK